jgi:phenylalanyl-tRNA synthetase beta chain
LKAVIARMLPGKNLQFSPRERPGFVLGCDVLCDGVNLGVAARLLPSRERALDFTAPVWLAELDLAKLRKLIGQRIAVEELPQFPGSSRDAAMEMPADLMAAKVDDVIAAVHQPLLEQFHCFDVFCDPTGQKLDASRKSMAYRFHYRAADRTLKAEEVDAAHATILEKLLKELPVHFR